jgi:DNA-binding response OmpR family regulator
MKKIYIIDDDSDFLEFMGLCLINPEYQVFTVQHPDNISFTKNDLPDLIILDYSLPVENGALIASKLKHDTTTAQVPILMVSADNSIERMTKEAGADAFLPKPIEVDDLLDVVEELTT